MQIARKCAPKWIVEDDIKGCFDNINHKWLLETIPMDKRIMRQFLKSGFIYQGILFPTETGAPQGGAISSIYANMTLDGLEKLIQDKYHRNSKEKIENHYRAKTKVNLARYADDFIIPADSKEIAEDIKLLVSDFLHSRSLQLSEEKTAVTHIDNGLDFLGWTFRKFRGELLIKPSKESIKRVVRKLSDVILKESKASTQVDMIRRLNLIIRGWTNYHKHPVASKAFSNVNNTLYLLLQRWAKHRHPNKNTWWRRNRYWHKRGEEPWLFSSDENALINLRTIHIARYPNLQITKNPFLDPEYFKDRRTKIQRINAA